VGVLILGFGGASQQALQHHMCHRRATSWICTIASGRAGVWSWRHALAWTASCRAGPAAAQRGRGSGRVRPSSGSRAFK
jgi:hypothetical protein